MTKSQIYFASRKTANAHAYITKGEGKVRINNFQTVNTSFAKFLVTMKKIGATFETKKQSSPSACIKTRPA